MNVYLFFWWMVYPCSFATVCSSSNGIAFLVVDTAMRVAVAWVDLECFLVVLQASFDSIPSFEW